MSDDSTAREGVEAAADSESTAAEEVAKTEVQEAEAVADDETDVQEGVENEDGEQEDEAEAVEEIEFDFGGNKLKVPKGSVPEELVEQLDKFTKGTWSDYTKKSQDIAERSKALEARESAVEKIVGLNGEALQTYSKGLQIKADLEQLSQVDLNALWQSDPDQARRVSDAISRKQAEFQNVVSQVAQKEQELTQAQQAELARRMDEGKQLIERRIKGFSEKAPEVINYVVETYGMSKEEAETWPLNPKTAEMAYKAMMFDRMQASAKKAPKPEAPKASPVKPMKGKGSVQKDITTMTPGEMAKHLGLPG